MSLVYSGKAPAPGQRRPGIYIGGKADAKSLDKLERWRISHILNVTPTKEASIKAGVANYFESSNRFVYKRVSVYDVSTSAQDLQHQAKDIVKFISNGLHHGSVLVHCAQGMSRSTTCVLFYLMDKQGYGLQEALQMVQRRRPTAQPISAFMDMLQDYEASVKRKRKATGTATTTTPATLGDSSPSKSTKKQRMGATIGPSIGPPIGPSIGPATKAPSPKADQPTDESKAIGPSPPPTASNNGTASKTTSGIGPAMPPTTDDASSKKSIGPSWPPPGDK